jgi:hypothetical protein
MPKPTSRKWKSNENELAILHFAEIPLVKVLVKTDLLPVLKNRSSIAIASAR